MSPKAPPSPLPIKTIFTTPSPSPSLPTNCILCSQPLSLYSRSKHCKIHKLSFHYFCLQNLNHSSCPCCISPSPPSSKPAAFPLSSLLPPSVPHACYQKNCRSQELHLLPTYLPRTALACPAHKEALDAFYSSLKRLEDPATAGLTREQVADFINLVAAPLGLPKLLYGKFIPVPFIAHFPVPYLTHQVRNGRPYAPAKPGNKSSDRPGDSNKTSDRPGNGRLELVGAAGKYLKLRDKKTRADVERAILEGYCHPDAVVGLITSDKNPSYGPGNFSCGVFALKDIPGKVVVLGEYKGVVQSRTEHAEENQEDGYFFGVNEEGRKGDSIGVNALKARNVPVFANDWRNHKSKRKRIQNTLCVEVKFEGKHHIIWITAGGKIRKGSELLTDYGEDYWKVHSEYLNIKEKE